MSERLITEAELALVHVLELEDAWRSRNVEIRVALEKALARDPTPAMIYAGARALAMARRNHWNQELQAKVVWEDMQSVRLAECSHDIGEKDPVTNDREP